MSDSPHAATLFVDQSGVLGGAEQLLLDLVRRRLEVGVQGDTVALLADGPFAERLRDVGARVEVLPFAIDVQKSSGVARQLLSGPRVLGVAHRLARLARRHDVVHANTQKAAVVGAIASRLAHRPLVWHLHDILDADHFSPANRRVVIMLTNRTASRVIANSAATAEAYYRAGGRIDLHVVLNGVDPEPFDSVTELQTQQTRANLGVPTDTPLVGLFGRLTPWKGQHVLLDSLDQPELTRVHAAIVGDALFTKEDLHYAEELRRRSYTGTLQGRVHWLGHRDDVPALMRACDMVIHCSTHPEPFGLVICEAQLATRPVIATAAGGVLEILADNENGLLVAPGDAASLAAAIGRLIHEPITAHRLAEAGRSTAIERFGLDRCVAEVNAVLDAAAARH